MVWHGMVWDEYFDPNAHVHLSEQRARSPSQNDESEFEVVSELSFSLLVKRERGRYFARNHENESCRLTTDS
jgi:hypothetical protein